MRAGASTEQVQDLVKTLSDSLKKMQKRLDASEDALVEQQLTPEQRAYHVQTVAHYRSEITRVRATLVELTTGSPVDNSYSGIMGSASAPAVTP